MEGATCTYNQQHCYIQHASPTVLLATMHAGPAVLVVLVASAPASTHPAATQVTESMQYWSPSCNQRPPHITASILQSFIRTVNVRSICIAKSRRVSNPTRLFFYGSYNGVLCTRVFIDFVNDTLMT